MTRALFTLPAWIALGLALSGSAFAGHATGGGNGELTTTENNPWFIGEKEDTATYCVQIMDFFVSIDGPYERELEARRNAVKDVEWALNDWTQTLRNLDITPTPPLLDSKRKTILTRFQKVEPDSTTGFCPRDVDLLFDFGRNLMPEEYSPGRDINEAPEYHLVGFARQTSYDEKTGRARGKIWIAPGIKFKPATPGHVLEDNYWSTKRTRLRNVLLHELGHVFGFPHIPDTLMDEQFPAHAVLDRVFKPYPQATSREFVIRQFRLPTGPKRLCAPLDWNFKPFELPQYVLGELGNNWEICVETITPAQPQIFHGLLIFEPKSKLKFTITGVSNIFDPARPKITKTFELTEHKPGTEGFVRIQGRYATLENPVLSIVSEPHVFLNLQTVGDVSGILKSLDTGRKTEVRLQFPTPSGWGMEFSRFDEEADDLEQGSQTFPEVLIPWVR